MAKILIGNFLVVTILGFYLGFGFKSDSAGENFAESVAYLCKVRRTFWVFRKTGAQIVYAAYFLKNFRPVCQKTVRQKRRGLSQDKCDGFGVKPATRIHHLLGPGPYKFLHARFNQELQELQKILAFIDSRLESIEQFLNRFTDQPNETNINDPESDDGLVETPLVSPFPHSDNDSDDEEVLNELSEYENAGTLRRERIINSLDGDDLAFECIIGFRKFTAYLDPFLPMNIISHKAYNTIMVDRLEGTRKNLVAIVRDVYVLVAALHARFNQELQELKKILAFIDSRLENIEQFLNLFTDQPNETNVNDPESDDGLVETPLVSPFPHSDNDSDDEEVLNELSEYENARTLRRERIINSLDGDDLAFECIIGFRKFTAYLDPFLPMNIISHKAYNTIMVDRLEGTRKNLVAIVRDVYVLVGSFTYITDFVVLEDIGEFIMSNMAEVLMGKPFRKITKLKYDVVKGLVSFTKIFDTYTYRMPHTIPRLKNFN
ncbi:hypothetical protein Tco_0506473 [Tanacetum coccineum]